MPPPRGAERQSAAAGLRPSAQVPPCAIDDILVIRIPKRHNTIDTANARKPPAEDVPLTGLVHVPRFTVGGDAVATL
jgi:hypothetical protein